jgi:hypothetical protein
MVLLPEIITLILLNIVATIFGSIALIYSVIVLLKYDANKTTPLQYQLEKQSFLTTTIIKYIFAIKIPLFLLFIYTLDKISTILTGAMCASGVVDATSYGLPLLTLKILTLYLYGLWLALHFKDMKDENQPNFILKFRLYIPLFVLLVIESVFELSMFTSIDVDKIVSCCGTLFSLSKSSTLSNILFIDPKIILFVFYANFILLLIFYHIKVRYLYTILNILFILSSLVALITFFSPYIYELPTHHCPFCLLQSDYYYVGYILYISLFFGTFYGIKSDLLNQNDFTKSIVFNSIYLITTSSYVVSFYIRNGTFLS